MTTDRLRSAAATLRNAAGGATSGEWCDYNSLLGHVTTLAGTEVAVANPADAAYVATMGPPVALALAAWLERMADMSASGNDIPAMRGRGLEEALVVVDAVLGEG